MLRPNGTRATAAITVLYILLGLEILMGIGYLVLYFSVSTSLFQFKENTELIIGISIGISSISILYIIGFIVSAVTFIMWFRRAYYNMEQHVTKLSSSNGWAAGAWFIPFFNLVKPFQIMSELYENTIALFKYHKMENPHEPRISIVGWWWAFWIINNLFSNISSRLMNNVETLEQLSTGTLLETISSCLGIISCMFAILVIHRYSRMEPLMMEVPAMRANPEENPRSDYEN